MQIYVRRDEEQGYGLEFDDEGCVTAAEGAADEAGVRVGWTITHVDGDAVAHRDEIYARLRELDGAELTLAQVPEGGARAAAGQGAGLDDIFARFDRDGDGVLDQDEVQAMLDSQGFDVDADYVGGMIEMFGRYDEDGGGTIDIAEFAPLWEKIQAAAPEPALTADDVPADAAAAASSGASTTQRCCWPWPVLRVRVRVSQTWQ